MTTVDWSFFRLWLGIMAFVISLFLGVTSFSVIMGAAMAISFFSEWTTLNKEFL